MPDATSASTQNTRTGPSAEHEPTAEAHSTIVRLCHRARAHTSHTGHRRTLRRDTTTHCVVCGCGARVTARVTVSAAPLSPSLTLLTRSACEHLSQIDGRATRGRTERTARRPDARLRLHAQHLSPVWPIGRHHNKFAAGGATPRSRRSRFCSHRRVAC